MSTLHAGRRKKVDLAQRFSEWLRCRRWVVFDLSFRPIRSRLEHHQPPTGRGPEDWSQRRDSNPQPADYKSAALPIEPRWRIAGRGPNTSIPGPVRGSRTGHGWRMERRMVRATPGASSTHVAFRAKGLRTALAGAPPPRGPSSDSGGTPRPLAPGRWNRRRTCPGTPPPRPRPPQPHPPRWPRAQKSRLSAGT